MYTISSGVLPVSTLEQYLKEVPVKESIVVGTEGLVFTKTKKGNWKSDKYEPINSLQLADLMDEVGFKDFTLNSYTIYITDTHEEKYHGVWDVLYIDKNTSYDMARAFFIDYISDHISVDGIVSDTIIPVNITAVVEAGLPCRIFMAIHDVLHDLKYKFNVVCRE